jgi:hypothetical protein
MTDHLKLPLIKNAYFALKKFGVKIDLREGFEQFKTEYNRIQDILVKDIMTNENYKGGKLINFDILPDAPKVEELQGGDNQNDQDDNN